MTVCMRGGPWLACAVVGIALAGCSSKSLNRAPVVDRGAKVAADVRTADAPVKMPQGFENAGKAGYYTVKPGDTLLHIALETGQSHKDIRRWSSLEDPNRIEVGQVLRVVPPSASEPVAPAATAAAVTTKPVVAATATPVVGAPAGASTAPAAAAAPLATPVKPAATPPAVASAGEDDLGGIWPSKGPVLTAFDEVKNKGIDIGGNAGDPISAVADGKVVYAGDGLRGYGNLIIIKHSNTYLTAYAHNRKLLVAEDQAVKKGQKIAEMGDSGTDRVKLHFEVRKQGKPVDPVKYLPTK